MNMKHLEPALEDDSIASCPHSLRGLQTNLRITLDGTYCVTNSRQ